MSFIIVAFTKITLQIEKNVRIMTVINNANLYVLIIKGKNSN